MLAAAAKLARPLVLLAVSSVLTLVVVPGLEALDASFVGEGDCGGCKISEV